MLVTAGDATIGFGFQLTANPNKTADASQQGHFICLVEFEASGTHAMLNFEYNMSGDISDQGVLERLIVCGYGLVDRYH